MRRRPGVAAGEAHVLQVLPRLQVRRRVDGAVVAEADQPDWMNLEVQVRRRPLRIAGVADEAQHVARVDLVAVDRERRERRQVRVVEEFPWPSRTHRRLPPTTFQPTEKTVPDAT